MRKKMCLGFAILLVALMVLASCATLSKKSITTGDLPALKGKWEGERLITEYSGKLLVQLEINNDTLPLRGKWTFYDVLLSGIRGKTEEGSFNDGQIDKAGNLVIKLPETQFTLTLYKDQDKMKLEGGYYYKTVKGTIKLFKK